MTTPEVTKDLFTEAQAAITPIVGAPNNDHGKRITEAFINALQSIDVPGGAIDLSNLLLLDTVTKQNTASARPSGACRFLSPPTTTASPPMLSL